MEYKTKVQIDELKDLIDKFGKHDFDFRTFGLIENDSIRKSSKKKNLVFGLILLISLIAESISLGLPSGMTKFICCIAFVLTASFSALMLINIFCRAKAVQNMIDRAEFGTVFHLENLFASNLKTLSNIPGPWTRENLLKCLFILESGTTDSITVNSNIEAEMAKAISNGYQTDTSLTEAEQQMVYQDIAMISKELSPEAKAMAKKYDFAKHLNQWISKVGSLQESYIIMNQNYILSEFLGYDVPSADYNTPKLKSINNEKSKNKVSNWIKYGNNDAKLSDLINDLYNFEGWETKLAEREKTQNNNEVKVKSLQELNQRFLEQERELNDKDIKFEVGTLAKNIVKLIDAENNYKKGKLAIFKMKKVYLPYLQDILDKYIKIQGNVNSKINSDVINLCKNINQAISEKILPDIIEDETIDLKADTMTLEQVLKKDGLSTDGIVIEKKF